MFDELRHEADDFSFEESSEHEEAQDVYSLREKPGATKSNFLGMTPVQRFIIALMLLLMTCMLSTFFLLVTERIALPFFS